MKNLIIWKVFRYVALATSLDQDWESEKVSCDYARIKGLEFNIFIFLGGRRFISKSIEEKGENGLEEERRLAYVELRAKKLQKFHFQ